MYRILVVIGSAALMPELSDDYNITFCQTAEEAAAHLKQDYDGMILDLFLPGTDGLTFLEEMQHHLPPVVLVLTRLLTPYILQSVEFTCGGYILRIPCSEREIRRRLEDMFRKFSGPVSDASAVAVRYHLHRLRLSAGKGFRRITEILPTFDPDKDPCLFNDYYPDLAKKDSVTMEAIDNSVHRTIQQAYERRNDAVWKEYFPDTARCPKNKEFLSAVARRMKEKDPSR